MSDPKLVARIVGELLASPGEQISLDGVANAIGAAPVGFDDIEAIFDALEAAGRHVHSEPRDPPAALGKVLAAVRSFSAVSGRRPSLAEIATHSGLTAAEVKFALLYARVLVR